MVVSRTDVFPSYDANKRNHQYTITEGNKHPPNALVNEHVTWLMEEYYMEYT